ncbi:hypothetical protein LINGRAHAP2_LOCUS32382 [Linum grandiflorum]
MSKQYATWTKHEENTLMGILVALHDCGQLRNGALVGCTYNELGKRLKAVLPETRHDAGTVRTKFRSFKAKFTAQLELLNVSGMGWDDALGCCMCDSDMWDGWVKGHPAVKGLWKTKLAHWDELCKIFEFNRADGTKAMTANDAASVLEAELGATGSNPVPSYDTYDADRNPIMADLT